MEGKLTILGSGASLGVPLIGCSCSVCKSPDPRNQRMRAAALYEREGKKLLIDVGPDFHFQALRYGVHHIDALLLTHTHYDHIAGIDELRVYTFKDQKPLPVFLSPSSMKDLERRYDYLVSSGRCVFHLLEGEAGQIKVEGIDLSYFTYTQTGMKVTGFRVGDTAYVSDIKEYSPEIFEQLQGVKNLVISALRWTVSAAHLTVEEAVAFAKKVGAKQTYFTHISHELDHEATHTRLPKGVALAYDGLTIR